MNHYPGPGGLEHAERFYMSQLYSHYQQALRTVRRGRAIIIGCIIASTTAFVTVILVSDLLVFKVACGVVLTGCVCIAVSLETVWARQLNRLQTTLPVLLPPDVVFKEKQTDG